MSEYPIGDNGEMIHVFDDSPYAQRCWARLERDVMEETNLDGEEK